MILPVLVGVIETNEKNNDLPRLLQMLCGHPEASMMSVFSVHWLITLKGLKIEPCCSEIYNFSTHQEACIYVGSKLLLSKLFNDMCAP